MRIFYVGTVLFIICGVVALSRQAHIPLIGLENLQPKTAASWWIAGASVFVFSAAIVIVADLIAKLQSWRARRSAPKSVVGSCGPNCACGTQGCQGNCGSSCNCH